jgi:hypothetical protein
MLDSFWKIICVSFGSEASYKFIVYSSSSISPPSIVKAILVCNGMIEGSNRGVVFYIYNALIADNVRSCKDFVPK